MFKKVMILFFLCLSLNTNLYAGNCDYSFSKNDGDSYSLAMIVDFVTKEIRPSLSKIDNMIAINIVEACEGKPSVKTMIGMNTRNYYLLDINGISLPDHIVRYNNRLALDINKDTFKEFIANTPNQNFSKFILFL